MIVITPLFFEEVDMVWHGTLHARIERLHLHGNVQKECRLLMSHVFSCMPHVTFLQFAGLAIIFTLYTK